MPLLRHLENSPDDAQNSTSGAIGRYQIMPGVGRSFGVEPEDLYDAGNNTRVAQQLSQDLWKRYNGNAVDVLVAWNAGTRRANRWIANGRKGGDLPPETRSFISRASPFLSLDGKSLPSVMPEGQD